MSTMDKIASFGPDIIPTILPTYKLLGDILNQPENARAVRATKRETLPYGEHERHVLDLFTPSTSTPNPAGNNPRPVFLFVYGGGFKTGDRVIPAVEGELVYVNVGSFMADKVGFETIIMDYSLIQHGAKYPSGGEEIDMVIKWLEKRFAGQAQRDIYIMGNSAGGAHVLTWLFEQPFEESVKRLTAGQGVLKLKSVALVGSPFRWYFKDVDDEFVRDGLLGYYGDETNINETEPNNVMKKAIDRATGDLYWPPIIVAVSELDPVYMQKSGREFVDIWTQAGGKGSYWVLEGHNHLSPMLCLGTGGEKEEAWGYELVMRMKELS